MTSKYEEQLEFWKGRLRNDRGTFQNKHYERIMLGMARESNQGFLQGKIVADFGCGPRGSLVWAGAASLRIFIGSFNLEERRRPLSRNGSPNQNFQARMT